MSNETPDPPFAWAVWGWLLQAAAIALAVHTAYAGPIDGRSNAMGFFGLPLLVVGIFLCRAALLRPVRLPPVLTGLALALQIGGYVILSGAEEYALLPASAIRPARAMVATAWLCMLAISIIVYIRSRRSDDVDPAMSNETPEPPFAWTVWGWLLQAAGISLIVHAAYAGPIGSHDPMMHVGVPLCFVGVMLCRYSIWRSTPVPLVLAALAPALFFGGYAVLIGAEEYALLPASAIRPARGILATAWLCMLAISIIVYIRSRRSADVDPASPQGEGS